ncbi:MAG: hypothetical protein C4522_03075 [Desulfobacteraceae bacterium]|nr:MAG: hypothetical protein C4522_03075 [Desulfobacteraceae bacterium]
MEKHYSKIFLIIILVKLFFAWIFPVTTDEAYWLILGNHPDVNYYDHPPMSGWAIYLFSLPGGHVFFARLYTILYGILVALGIYVAGKKLGHDPDKAKLASLIFLVSPLHVLFVLIATDTSLCVFVFLAGISFYFGNARNKRSLIFLSGMFLGLAVLSKYFSGLMLIAMMVSLFVCRRWKQAILDSIILVSGAIPFVLLHLYWSSLNCWTNFMFNVINRNQNIETEYTGLVVFFALQVYLCTPWLLYYMFQDYRQIREGIKKDGNLFFLLFLVPLLLLGFVSLHHTGLHWYFSFYPFLFPCLFYIRTESLRKVVKYSALFTGVHLVIVAVALVIPTETLKGFKHYKTLLIYRHGDEIYQAIQKKYGDHYIPAGNSYSTASVMTYYSGREFMVFAGGSKYGRHFDKLNDFRELDGKDILIFASGEDYHEYFDQVEQDTLTIRHHDFPITIGKGFRYQRYRDVFLAWVREKFYDIPDFLPVNRCFFLDRYFPADEQEP